MPFIQQSIYRNKQHFGRATAAVAIVAAIGVIILMVSHAATPYSSSEAESGILTTGAAITSDSTASSGDAVQFGTTIPTSLINIMPLGDSITTGFESTDGGGWRTYIWNDLKDAGYNYALVGALQNGPSYIGSHSGYPGWTCANLESVISAQLTQYKPQVVMLECGANDIETGVSPSNTAARIATLIDMIQSQSPNTYVILANLTPININSGTNSLAQQVNALLPSIVSTRQAEGRPISFVDMYDNMDTTNSSGVFTDITSGQDHPDDAGYNEMSQVWWPALVKAISNVGGSATPPKPVALPFHMAAGESTGYTDSSGTTWLPDQYASGGYTDNQAAGHVIAGTTNAQLYQSEHYDMTSYNIPVSNGTHTVTLDFAEIYSGCVAVGCRVFSVSAEGVPVLTNFDIVQDAGAAYTADDKSFTVNVVNNMLSLDFTNTTGAATLSGIEIQ
jgi:lysophospholipase L1-like esterase